MSAHVFITVTAVLVAVAGLFTLLTAIKNFPLWPAVGTLVLVELLHILPK